LASNEIDLEATQLEVNMKRILGWGNTSTDYPVPEPARQYLEKVAGEPRNLKNITVDQLIEKIPASNLPPNSQVSADPEDRLRHARGQSLNDWIDMCDGLVNTFPDGIAYPASEVSTDHDYQIPDYL